MSYGAEKIFFCHFESHGGEDDFTEEQVGEDEMDRESNSEEDSIPRMDPSSSDRHSEDDEPSIAILQLLHNYGLLQQRDGEWCFIWLRQS